MGKVQINPVNGKKLPTGDYPVGFARPPTYSRFRPGQSGYPPGRPRGSRNRKSELKEVVEKRIEITDNGKKRKISLLAANLLTHGAKGAKGDARSAALFLNKAHEMGLLDLSDSGSNASAEHRGLPSTSRPSEVLTQNLDTDLLSRDDQIELSRLGDIIDLGGDVTALTTANFERFKYLLNKGRGKDVTPQ